MEMRPCDLLDEVTTSTHQLGNIMQLNSLLQQRFHFSLPFRLLNSSADSHVQCALTATQWEHKLISVVDANVRVCGRTRCSYDTISTGDTAHKSLHTMYIWD